jgi:hypothetical protein
VSTGSAAGASSRPHQAPGSSVCCMCGDRGLLPRPLPLLRLLLPLPAHVRASSLLVSTDPVPLNKARTYFRSIFEPICAPVSIDPGTCINKFKFHRSLILGARACASGILLVYYAIKIRDFENLIFLPLLIDRKGNGCYASGLLVQTCKQAISIKRLPSNIDS